MDEEHDVVWVDGLAYRVPMEVKEAWDIALLTVAHLRDEIQRFPFAP